MPLRIVITWQVINYLVIRFLTQPSRATDRPIRVNPDICWVRWQSRSTDQRNGRKIIVICFEFGPGMRVSYHPEEKISECAVMREVGMGLDQSSPKYALVINNVALIVALMSCYHFVDQ